MENKELKQQESVNTEAKGKRRTEDTREEPRRERIPLTRQNNLYYPEIAGFKLRWVNDTPGRLKKYEEAGYNFVEEEVDGRKEKVKKSAGVNKEGRLFDMYLMKLPEKYWQEDLKRKHDINEEIISQTESKNNALLGDTGKIDVKNMSKEQLRELKEALKNI
jgi:hypothetical protein